MKDLELLPQNLVFSDGKEAFTDSYKIAKAFGKEHFHVLRTIEKLECSDDFAKSNFGVCFKNNDLQNGKPQKYYRITQGGAMYLIMGFTGKKAASIKEGFIVAFENLVEQINTLKEIELLEINQKKEKDEVSKCASRMSRWGWTVKDYYDTEITKRKLKVQSDLFPQYLIR